MEPIERQKLHPRFTAKALVLALLLLLVYYAIFSFSAQDGKTSASLSGSIAAVVAKIVKARQPELIHTTIRKCAHVTEYAVLYALWFLLLREMLPDRPARFGYLVPLGTGVLSAAGDELHQYFVPGRAGLVTDVLIDTFGMCLMMGLLFCLFRARERRADSR